MLTRKVKLVFEIAKTVKTTADAVKAIEETGTGQFIGRVFGGVFEDSLGMIGDAIKFKRIEFYERHVQKTKDNLKERGIDWQNSNLNPVPPKIAIPVFERASLEDNDELHTLWSNLLANAMDPNFRGDIKSRHVAILKEMEPLDLKILDACYIEKMKNNPKNSLDEVMFEKVKVIEKFALSEHVVEVAILNLIRLGCVKGGNVRTSLSFGDMNGTIYQGTAKFTLSALGVELCMAAMSQ